MGIISVCMVHLNVDICLSVLKCDVKPVSVSREGKYSLEACRRLETETNGSALNGVLVALRCCAIRSAEFRSRAKVGTLHAAPGSLTQKYTEQRC